MCPGCELSAVKNPNVSRLQINRPSAVTPMGHMNIAAWHSVENGPPAH
jgi:hypothetical protein